MARPRKQYRLVPGPQPGDFHLPDGSATVYFIPVERMLYAHESVYDNKRLMEDTMASLCDESHTVFYSTVSRIKKKFITAFGGVRKARPYIIARGKDGLYRTRATLE